MHVAARARLVLARRPSLYWLVVAVLAALAAYAVHAQQQSIGAERERWGASKAVLIAARTIEPGDEVVAELVDLPVAALPDDALTEASPGMLVRQRVAKGAVLTRFDVTAGRGPAALAGPGTVVVALSDPLARDVAVGLAVQVAADGLVLADAAVVSAVVDDVVFVAVDRRDAPSVAAAAQQGAAALLYLP
jgi:hypothetical protein